MNMTTALIVLKALAELEKISGLATADGRWNALQDWLKTKPKWRKEINKWVELTPDGAFASLRDFAAEYTDMPPVVLENLIDAGMKIRVKSSIQTLQTLYRERKEVQHEALAH